MKKSLKLLALAILAGFAFSTSSCTKCQTCNYVASDGTVLQTVETCGDKNTRQGQEDDCIATANALSGSSCNCTVSYSI